MYLIQMLLFILVAIATAVFLGYIFKVNETFTHKLYIPLTLIVIGIILMLIFVYSVHFRGVINNCDIYGGFITDAGAILFLIYLLKDYNFIKPKTHDESNKKYKKTKKKNKKKLREENKEDNDWEVIEK